MSLLCGTRTMVGDVSITGVNLWGLYFVDNFWLCQCIIPNLLSRESRFRGPICQLAPEIYGYKLAA